jgi:hypothetical protein
MRCAVAPSVPQNGGQGVWPPVDRSTRFIREDFNFLIFEFLRFLGSPNFGLAATTLCEPRREVTYTPFFWNFIETARRPRQHYLQVADNSPEATFHHLGWTQRSMTTPVLIAKPKTPMNHGVSRPITLFGSRSLPPRTFVTCASVTINQKFR